jgi:hypothetical protein
MKRFLMLILILSFMGSMTLSMQDNNNDIYNQMKMYIKRKHFKVATKIETDNDDFKSVVNDDNYQGLLVDDDVTYFDANFEEPMIGAYLTKILRDDIMQENTEDEGQKVTEDDEERKSAPHDGPPEVETSTKIVKLPVTIAEMKRHVGGDDIKTRDLIKKAILKFLNLSAENERDVKVELKSEKEVEITSKFVQEPSRTDDQFQAGFIASLKKTCFGPLWKHDLVLPFRISELEKVAGKQKVDEIIKKAILTTLYKDTSAKDAVTENDFTVKLEEIESGKKTKIEIDFLKTPSPKVKENGFYDRFIEILKESSLKSRWKVDTRVVTIPTEDKTTRLSAGAITAIVIGSIVGCLL